MKKNKTIALTLGLTMLTMSATPVFAQSSNASWISSIANKNSNSIVINLDEDAIGNIAVDLGLSRYQVESVLTDSYKQTKPVDKPKKDDYLEVTTLPAEVDNHEAVTTLPEVIIEPEPKYEDIMTLPAEVQQPQICPPNVTEDGYQEVTTLPAEVDNHEAVTTLPEGPQVCPDVTENGYQEVTTLPAEVQQPQICPPNVTEDGYQEVTTLPAEVDTAVSKETRPFLNPSKVINAIKDNEDLNLVVVSEEQIETLSELSGYDVDYVTEILEYGSIEKIYVTRTQDITTLPAEIK